mmetsp:Transcript_22504/g.69660  ORF Transcript_22504/g.69660 Transcript_22504/m.69660 type:complete len:237 (+) Transcript_22504:224-934(+)
MPTHRYMRSQCHQISAFPNSTVRHCLLSCNWHRLEKRARCSFETSQPRFSVGNAWSLEWGMAPTSSRVPMAMARGKRPSLGLPECTPLARLQPAMRAGWTAGGRGPVSAVADIEPLTLDQHHGAKKAVFTAAAAFTPARGSYLRLHSPVSGLKTRAWPSSQAVSTLPPSAEKTAEFTASGCSTKARSHVPVAASKSRTSLSMEAVSTCRVSGEKAAEHTQSPWPLKLRSQVPVAAS